MNDPLLTGETVKPGIPVRRSTLITIALSVLVLAFVIALLMDDSGSQGQGQGGPATAKVDPAAAKEETGSKIVIDEELRKAKEAAAEEERKQAQARGEKPAAAAAPAVQAAATSQQPVGATPAQTPTSPLPPGVQRTNQDSAFYESKLGKLTVPGAGSTARSEADPRKELEHESDFMGRTSKSVAFDEGAVDNQRANGGDRPAGGRLGVTAPVVPEVAQPSMSRIPEVKPVVSQPASAGMQNNYDRIAAALQGQGGGLPGMTRTSANASGGNTGWLNEYAGSSQGKTNDVIRSYPTSSRFTLHQGKAIPAVLGKDINSQLPGEITAYVTSDVYDSLGHGHLLIPKGSVLVGRYNSEVKMGQSRVMFAFQRIILPDGTSFDLPAAQGVDVGGASGVEGDVNNHFFKMFASSFFTAWLADRVQPQSTTSGFGGVTTQVSPAGQVLVDVSRTILDRNRSIQPTITVPKGARINIEVKKDMEFAGPYNRSRN